MVMVAGIGGLVMLFMGTKSWALIFLLAPAAGFVPFFSIAKCSVPILVGTGVLFYWMLLWLIGAVKFRWRSMPVLDILVVIMTIYMVAAYLRHPASMSMLGLDFDRVGGGEYAVFVVAVLYYIALSAIPMEISLLRRVLEWAAVLTIVGYILGGVLHLAGFETLDVGRLDKTSLKDAFGSRFMSFVYVGMYLMLYIYARFSMTRIMTSPLLIAACLFSFLCVILSAFRGRVLSFVVMILSVSFVKREITAVLCLIIAGIFGIYILNSAGLTEQLPIGAQRMITHLPGIKIDKRTSEVADDTIEWRLKLWELALDPRTGYIKDYVWGDGIGISASETARRTIAAMRGAYVVQVKNGERGASLYTADSSSWHNSVILSIQKLGFVGTSIILFTYAYVLYIIFRLTACMRDLKMKYLSIFFLFPIIDVLEELLTNTIYGMVYFMHDFFYFASAKFLYVTAREAGWLKDNLLAKRYVPQMIQEHGERIQSPLAQV